MEKEDLEFAVKLSKKVRSAEKRLEEVKNNFKMACDLDNKSEYRQYITFDYLGFPEVEISPFELVTVLKLCIERLEKEFSEIQNEFKNL